MKQQQEMRPTEKGMRSLDIVRRHWSPVMTLGDYAAIIVSRLHVSRAQAFRLARLATDVACITPATRADLSMPSHQSWRLKIRGR